ncbi:predicted protein [Histoplasma capsulatum G186AR]|uniref:Uncharacterized protein n=1 Tax=Ajellomyces capsulatus (strain G186AR / H82 / ATCC MYA-2454 / RMSCC 2432) TaxID=447093 RepID=C0NL16_AJECG|nr:uncharacterized protein HCBG_03846 [Histoplasma capsulatum G186AR]EEH08557.1 predicted protein [Histoplasma capsulatum G186AR]
MTNAEDTEDEDDIHLNVAEAGHQMMSSSLFSPRHLSWVILEKCLPAEACRDAFERMSKATVQMCLSTTGFGSDAALLGATRLRAAGEPISPNIAIETFSSMSMRAQQQGEQHRQLQPTHSRSQYDMKLQDCFPKELMNEYCHHPSSQYGSVSNHLPQHSIFTNHYHSLKFRTSSPIQPRKSTMTMQIFDRATSPITDSNAGSKNNNNNLDDTTLLVVGQTECE